MLIIHNMNWNRERAIRSELYIHVKENEQKKITKSFTEHSSSFRLNGNVLYSSRKLLVKSLI